MKTMDRFDVSEKVRENIKKYFKECLGNYDSIGVTRASEYPDDDYLYMVIAHNARDNTYTVWTCWNESTQSLNYGHYGLSFDDAKDVMVDYFHQLG